MFAYLTLRDWVRRFDPPELDDDASAIPIAGAEAACVVIRLRGRVLGVGIDADNDDRMLRRAAGRALSAVLGDRTVAALPPELRTSIAERLTVELEVAGHRVPLPGRSFAAIAEQLDPGIDGVGLRHSTAWQHLFPAQTLLSNTAGDIERRLPGMAMELELPIEFDECARAGARFYRFRTVHLAQRGPGRSPMELFRGSTLVPAGPLDDEAIAAMAGDLVDHILTRLVGQPGLGLTGTYRPAAGEYRPITGNPRDQALVALALAEFASLPGQIPAQAARLLGGARVILDDLGLVQEGEPDPMLDPAACAAMILAGGALDPAPPVSIDAEAGLLRAVGDHGLVAMADGTPVAPANQALCAAALARLARSAPENAGLRELARRATSLTWEAVEAPRQVTLLPWIAWAERDLGGAEAPSDTVRHLATVLQAARIEAATLAPEPPLDLDGGIALGGGTTRADAQSVRPIAFLAWARARGDLAVDADGLRRNLRFLLQLSIRDDDLWAFTNPTRVRGGLRSAPWDHDLPLAVQATALLALTEAMRAFEITPSV